MYADLFSLLRLGYMPILGKEIRLQGTTLFLCGEGKRDPHTREGQKLAEPSPSSPLRKHASLRKHVSLRRIAHTALGPSTLWGTIRGLFFKGKALQCRASPSYACAKHKIVPYAPKGQLAEPSLLLIELFSYAPFVSLRRILLFS